MTSGPPPDPDSAVVVPPPGADPSVQLVFGRAMRLVAIMGLVGSAVLAPFAGWQTAVLFLVGAAISFTGIREWRNVTTAVFDRFTAPSRARPAIQTFVTFFLRLGLAAAVLYASLRYLQGNVYALVAGLGLAIIALSSEALRLLRH